MQNDAALPETKSSPEGFDAAHDAILARSDVQAALPGVDPPSEPMELGWLEPLIEFIADLISFFAPVVVWLFWIGVALIVLFVLYQLVRALIDRRFGLRPRTARTKTDREVDLRPDAARARDLLAEADRLAREGAYAAAVHLLLHQSIEDMQARVNELIGASLTAREIGRMGQLSDRARAALWRLISGVERAVFGEAPVNQAAYLATRDDYETFALREGTG